ncbi:DUF1983 domain-containing protein [Photobacterium damselae subsp. damselae]|uniref:phage tail tip fiber protein n=1 Tax=Photobacterium damselae TaxID=38293 RepID=UPI001F26EBA2|nr:DUF1983 domain-containing protein [Photobacterium damselae]UJZ96340.1 DUF1983 domain-containing protein [Photobacterium damselae subsp. damselae]UJZ99756.1 DUF1983 domain-containing protein [Photobacterium damselae subsp. damselae]
MAFFKRSQSSGFRGGRDPSALQENMELLTGQRGNGLDRAITVRELTQLGLISVTRNTQGSVITQPRLPKPPADKPVEVPLAPSNVSGVGGFGAIMLEWKNPTFQGFAYTEIWRASPNADGSTPSIEQAILIATTPATVFSDIVEPGSTFYYWCRFININHFPGPFQNIDGVKVSTKVNIQDVIDEIGSQLKDSQLIQQLNLTLSNVSTAVETVSSSVESLNQAGSKAYQALWSTKAQAGDIQAGIGLLAKSDGTSQVAVSASQFVVFDPNISNGSTQPLFAIDKGRVIIPKALIETATIQILTAQHIIADEVRASIRISSPTINGGSVTGGWAGFGPGGRYNGWRTYINASGQVFTDGINAVNGSYTGHLYATSGEMQNVLIHESCEVRGRFYAENMVGDIYDQHYKWQTYQKPQGAPDILNHVGQYIILHRVWIREARRFARRINIEGAGCHIQASRYAYGAAIVQTQYWLNGQQIGSGIERRVNARPHNNIRVGSININGAEIPMNVSGYVEVRLVMIRKEGGITPSVFTHATGASFDSFQVEPVKASIWKKSTDLG